MKVLKFGGTSVGSVESIQRVKKIVDAMAEPAIVVVSAVGGITDKLIATTTKAVTSDTTYTTDFENICNIHNTIIDGVVPADKLASVKEQVNNLLEEVGTILKGVEGIGSITLTERDVVRHALVQRIIIAYDNYDKRQEELKIKRKPKQTAKYTYEYHSNVNVLIGEIKDQLPRLLTDNQEQIQQVLAFHGHQLRRAI